MEARQALFEESVRKVLHEVQVEFAKSRGEVARPVVPAEERSQYDCARRLLEVDDEVRHRSDRDAVLRWERRARGAPAELTRKWRGAWPQRQVNEILAKVNAEFGILDDAEVEVLHAQRG